MEIRLPAPGLKQRYLLLEDTLRSVCAPSDLPLWCSTLASPSAGCGVGDIFRLVHLAQLSAIDDGGRPLILADLEKSLSSVVPESLRLLESQKITLTLRDLIG